MPAFKPLLLLAATLPLWAATNSLPARAQAATKPSSIWIEGEKPDSENVKSLKDNLGRPELLSGGTWLHFAAEPAEVEKSLPADGALFSYGFQVDQGGEHQLWGRLGYETGRTPFDWRVDGGEWQTATPRLTDLVEIQFFNELGWQNLGHQTLALGHHQLEFRLRRTADKSGKTQRILFGLDAICLTTGKFSPHGKFKPDEDGRSDADRTATAHIFNAQAVGPDRAQTSTPLEGQWEACRDDEDEPKVIDEPMSGLPETPFWTAITVPGERTKVRPDLSFAHRLWYRTRVQVPAESKGGSFFIVFPQNSLNTTLLVNGKPCGFSRNPLAQAQMDVTAAIKPGEVNEILVGIRDAYYGYAPATIRSHFAMPAKLFSTGFQEMDYPVASHPESGIILTPQFVTTGAPAYVADVFCQPSVAKKSLGVDVSLKGGIDAMHPMEIVCEALDAETGKVAKTWDAKPITASTAGAENVQKLELAWADPQLWWPDHPHLYRLRTTVKQDGKAIDVRETPFGFREWMTNGPELLLNGVPYHAWADIHGAGDKDEWLAFHRKTDQTMMRLWGVGDWKEMNCFQALDWFDRNGVVLRRTGIMDGQNMNYKGYTEALGRNYREQLLQWIKSERNHPSIFCWSIENEMTYINAFNAGWSDKWEAVTAQMAKEVREQIDSTRLIMTDGGGAGKNQEMPVHGDHYVAGNWPDYPSRAYEPNVTGGGRNRWWWDMTRPRIIGEDYFYEGNHPELSYFGGEIAFTGKAGTLHASAVAERILQEGYRWANFAGWQFWITPGSGDSTQYKAFSRRAVFCRQWDWTFGSGQEARRIFAVFNDTPESGPMTFTWSLMAGGKEVSHDSTVHTVAPGTHQIFDVTLSMPETRERLEGELKLTLTVDGREVFADTKPISILPPASDRLLATKVLAPDLAVFDPRQDVVRFLKASHQPFTEVTSLDALPVSAKILIVGRDAIPAGATTDTRLASWALDGHRVIVLEQANPLRYQAVPGVMEAQQNAGRTAFPEDLTHPVFAGLADKDFFTWATGTLTAADLSRPPSPPSASPYPAKGAPAPAAPSTVDAGPEEEIVYRNAYRKPTSGARSLLQCHNSLGNTALAEVPVGDGVMLLSQLAIGEKLSGNATAQTLLANLINYAAGYHLPHNEAVAAVAEGSPLASALGLTGLQYTKATDALAAISGTARVAIVQATPTNLRMLADHPDAVVKFTGDGGYLLLNELTPDGLESYNKLVGYDHIIRPFHRERILFAPIKSRLTAGLTASDLVMYSSQRIFPWMEGNYTDEGEFSYVVDLDDVAPFGKSSFGNYDKIVNGFTNADGWPLIINFPVKDGEPFDIPITLPRSEVIREFTWIGNANYNVATKVALVFPDGSNVACDVAGDQPMTFPVEPPRPAAALTLRILDWEKNKLQPDGTRTTGIDNIFLRAQRPSNFREQVKPMLNIGAMVEYPRGKGGIVLCNLAFRNSEQVPANAVKKQGILSRLLHNLYAPFKDARTIIAGSRLKYEPIDISSHATAFRDEKGWLGDKNFTFRDIPTGEQVFANVKYNVYDFPTSPVPTVIVLAGPNTVAGLPMEVKGIDVHRKADALFFLHAARLDARRSADDVKKGKNYELFEYVVHYADGKDERVPVLAEQDVEDYKQKGPPLMIPGAAVAWSAPYGNTGYNAVAYSKQWNNPRPEVEIQSVSIRYGADKRGVPAVLAITAASAEQP